MRLDAIPFEIELTRSARRRKTVAARLVGDVIRVTVPAAMPEAEAQRHAADLARRITRKQRSEAVDIATRAAALARRFRLPAPTSVTWVSNQEHRWGSCTPATGHLRISDRMAAFPPWVLDYVLVHELAHLAEANHSPAFHALVDRYPLAERARGYLIAKGLDEG